jgi:hypothetical protein
MAHRAYKAVAKALASAMLGLTLALSGFGALAEAPGDVGWYVGAAIGQAQTDVDCAGTTACDDKDSSWKILPAINSTGTSHWSSATPIWAR